MEDDLKISKLNISATTNRIFLKFQTKAQGTKSKLKMLEMKTTSDGRRPSIEDNLKILNVEYLSNHWSDLSQISNLGAGEQIKIKNTWK